MNQVLTKLFTGRIRPMEVLATFTDVKLILISEYIPEPEGKEEAKILVEAIKEFGEWDGFAGEGNRAVLSRRGYKGNLIELDFDTVINFECLDIWEVTRSGRCTILRLFRPTDIAVIDTEELLMPPSDPQDLPRAVVVISAVNSLEAPLEAGPWADKSVTEC